MATTFQIPGMTIDAIKSASTSAPATSGRPFPGALGEYVNGVTGEVRALSIKQIGDGEYFSAMVTNNGHSAEILLATDPQVTNPNGKKSHEEQAQENLTTLTRFIKHLGIYNAKGEVDPSRFANAVGKLVTFTSRNKQSKDGKYINTTGYFKGEAQALVPVFSDGPSASPAGASAAEEIPF